LTERVSEVEARLIFNNAAHKVIKDTFKHAHYISVVTYCAQVNLLLFCTQVLKLLFFTLTCEFNSLLHAGLETANEAHAGQWDLSDQGPAPSGDS
jgi:hypothetical protein